MKNIFLLFTFLFSLTSFAQSVDIHPQAFNPGGWKVDVQFMDVMGSPYLLAHGNGIRCLDAKAVANIPEAGEWRVYVRSRSWVDGAGLKLMVNYLILFLALLRVNGLGRMLEL
mgnify:CR=1 FL=1